MNAPATGAPASDEGDSSAVTNGGPPPSGSSAPVSPNRRRRWPYVAAGLVGAGAVTAGVFAVTSGDDESSEAVETEASLSTVTAEVGDLVRFTDLDGRMVYADTEVVTAAGDGVVTGIVSVGEEISRGSVVADVNGTPVVAFLGDFPLFRPLSDGVSGDDVLIVEQNLAALGYHTELDDDGEPVDTDYTADGEWDVATTEAVERMQEDYGLPVTGQLEPGDVAVIAGDSVVIDTGVEVGDSVTPGAPLAELSTVSTIETFHAAHGGDVELQVAEGDLIEPGDIVYVVDDLPITAVVAPDGIDRDLRNGDEGDDVFAVESMLVTLGYDATGDLVVDTEFDDATETAVREFQEDLQNTYEDVTVDGRIGPDDLIVVAGDETGASAETVGAITVHDTDTLASGTELWSTRAGAVIRQVDTDVEVADQDRLTVGRVVDVEFPDGSIVSGTVTDVASSTTVDPTNPDAEATLAVTISLAEVPDAAAALVEADVTVKLVDELAEGVVIVPVGALVARGDGVYAVEALTTTGTTFITVEPGMFDDGFVEVEGLQAGVQVVVP